MPYTTKNPPNSIKNLPKGIISIYVSTFNAVYADTKDENKARQAAWGNVKNKYKKVAGKWIKKEEKSSFEMYITKSSINREGQMIFSCSASETIPDSFEQKTSIELYNSFIEHLDGSEYVSVAHYPEFEDKSGVLGYITQFYIDGTILKAKGYFLDTPEGVAAYNSIRKDRRDNVPYNERIRCSIGFYDYAHKHENNKVWKYELEDYCVECAIGNRKGVTFLNGKCIHIALTRKPALKSTSIEI